MIAPSNYVGFMCGGELHEVWLDDVDYEPDMFR